MYSTRYNKKPFTEDEIQDLLLDYNNGNSLTFLGKKFKCSSDPIKRILSQNNIKLRTCGEQKFLEKKYHCEHSYFDMIDSHEKAYWLGFLFADGYVNTKQGFVSFFLHKRDRYIVERFASDIESDFAFSKVKNCDGTKILSRQMVSDLVDKGCVQAKSLILDWPKNIEKKYLWNFVLGYFDGDGCIFTETTKKFDRQSIYIVSSTIFIAKLKEFLLEEGIKTVSVKTGKNIKTSVLSIRNTKDCMLFYLKVYENAKFFLKRKKDKFEDIFKKKIELCNKNPNVYNLTVLDTSYVLEDGNSSIILKERELKSFLKGLGCYSSRFFTISKKENGGLFKGLFIKRETKKSLIVEKICQTLDLKLDY